MKVLLYITAPLDVSADVVQKICRETGFRYWRTGEKTDKLPSLRIYMKSVEVEEDDGVEIPLTVEYLQSNNLSLYQVNSPP